MTTRALVATAVAVIGIIVLTSLFGPLVGTLLALGLIVAALATVPRTPPGTAPAPPIVIQTPAIAIPSHRLEVRPSFIQRRRSEFLSLFQSNRRVVPVVPAAPVVQPSRWEAVRTAFSRTSVQHPRTVSSHATFVPSRPAAPAAMPNRSSLHSSPSQPPPSGRQVRVVRR